MATTWSSSKFQGRAPDGHVLLRSFLGRAGIEAAAQLDDDEMTKVVRAELRQFMGIAAEPEFAQIFRWPRACRSTASATSRSSRRSRPAWPRCRASSSPAAPTTASASATACAKQAAAERALEHVRGLPEDAIPPQPDDVPAADGVVD